MPLFSAGLLPFSEASGELRVFIVHMGGPFWNHKDRGGWSLAKGMYIPGEEEPRAAALREFSEEVGVEPPPGELLDLGEVRLSSGKRVRGFAVEASEDLAFVSSNTFEVEWPRRSGTYQTYPEVDRAEWFPLDVARTKLTQGQVPLLDALLAALGRPGRRGTAGKPAALWTGAASAWNSGGMGDADNEAGAQPDPREQMKAALEAKKKAAHGNAAGAQGGPKASGGPHGQQGGKRTFRRKSGG